MKYCFKIIFVSITAHLECICQTVIFFEDGSSLKNLLSLNFYSWPFGSFWYSVAL